MRPAPNEVTLMLQQLKCSDQEALSKLVPLLYDDLRRLASAHLRRERPNHTLQTTALVHEAYLRLANQNRVEWKNRNHFFGMAAQLIRRILIDYARTHHAAKRGGDVEKASLEDCMVVSKQNLGELLALDEILGRLSVIDGQQARIVELRVFGGLTVEEIAQILDISPATVKRDWSVAKAWLTRELHTYVAGAPNAASI
jgi:RNA polymerase sigma-70 factor, ECF subfamily